VEVLVAPLRVRSVEGVVEEPLPIAVVEEVVLARWLPRLQHKDLVANPRRLEAEVALPAPPPLAAERSGRSTEGESRSGTRQQ